MAVVNHPVPQYIFIQCTKLSGRLPPSHRISSFNSRPTGYPHSIFKALRTPDGICNSVVMLLYPDSYRDFNPKYFPWQNIFIEQR